MTPDGSLVTKWLIELLRGDPNGYGVGDHDAPTGALSYPYFVVWALPGGSIGGPPLGAAAADATFVFQVDAVGQTAGQAQALAARGRTRIIGRTAAGSYDTAKASPSGIVILDRFLDGAPGAPLPEGSRPHEVWTSSERYAVGVTSQT